MNPETEMLSVKQAMNIVMERLAIGKQTFFRYHRPNLNFKKVGGKTNLRISHEDLNKYISQVK